MSTTVGAWPGGGAGRRLARPLTVVVVVAALALTALFVRADLDVRHQTHRADVQAAHLATQRRSVLHRIDRRRHELADAQEQLAAGRRTIGILDGQLASLRTALGTSSKNLANARHNVADTQSKIFAQASRINALGQCLNGVGNALNALAVGDENSALTSLQLVAAPCQQAAAEIPGISG
jgi:chromosome segregation ATPase